MKSKFNIIGYLYRCICQVGYIVIFMGRKHSPLVLGARYHFVSDHPFQRCSPHTLFIKLQYNATDLV